MAFEAVLVHKTEEPIDFIVANATGIEKGSFLALTDSRTGIAPSAVGQVCAGIARREKITTDGRTRLSVFMGGIFKVYASGPITIGTPLMLKGGANQWNKVGVAEGIAVSGPAVIGYALAAVADKKQFLMRLHFGGGAN